MDIKPCPFCGAENNSPVDGSSPRWMAIECCECGARSGEIRRRKNSGDTLHEDSMEAYAEWNRRAELDKRPPKKHYPLWNTTSGQ